MESLSDRELLKLAAKAVGYRIEFRVPDIPYIDAGLQTREWNPLTKDADARRILQDLELSISLDNERRAVSVHNQAGVSIEVGMPDGDGDIYAPLRRAIVCAAAKIGRSMPTGITVKSIRAKHKCDVCGNKRSIGDHRKCSRERQKRFQGK